MSILKCLLKLCFIFSFISQAIAAGHKYDLEVEAEKLYGEDFKSVLRRFRRTPDYLKILNDKMNDLKVYVKEMSLQVLHYYHGKMSQKVNDLVGVTRNYDETASSPATVYFHAYSGRRQEPEDINKKGIQQLDDYMAFNHALTVTERNSFKDLGFEFAGNLIHAIIHNMGPVVVETQPKSTRLPFGGQESDKTTLSTTEHPQVHEVTTAESTLAGGDEESTPETFRFRSQWDKVETFFKKF